jgi:outer membrane protein TolC
MMRAALRVAVVTALATSLAGPSAAQESQLPASEVLAPRLYQPPTPLQPALTLNDAVLFTLRHQPQIIAGTQRVRLAQGRLQETRGVFDVGLRVAPTLEFTLQEMSPGLRSRERLKRDTIRGVRLSFTELAADHRRALAGNLTTVPTCPNLFGFRGLDFTNTGINLDAADPTEVALRGVDRSVSPITLALGGDLGSIIQARVCSAQPQNVFSAEGFVGVWKEAIRVIDFTGGRGLEGALLSASQISREVVTLREEIARTVAERADIALARLGPIAKDELRRNVTFDVSLDKPFRSGSILRGEFQVQGQEHNFIGKPLDPAFGAFDVPHMFFMTGAGTWEQPLSRGRGAKGNTAFERAAQALVTSEEDQLRHGASEEVFRTVLSYLNLIGAQERVRLVQESRTRQAEILKLTQQRIAAGDIAQIEVARVQAREAAVVSVLNQTEADLIGARVALAESMGVTVSSLEAAPIASDPFATVPAVFPDTATLVTQALAVRPDTRAAAARQASATALLEGAQADARPLMNLSLTVGMANLYESPFFRFLPDEALPIIDTRATVVTPPVTGVPVPPLSPVRYWDSRGYYRALTGRYEPYGVIKFAWELPFGNNRAKGRVAQAQAQVAASAIDALNLNRVIQENVVDARETVERAASAVRYWETAVDNSVKTYESQRRLLEAGSVTLIDVLLTEEDLAQEQQQLLLQQMLYRSAIARLKFELGELIVFDNRGTPAERIRFLPSLFAGR